jgi:hypothetical protein
MRHGIGENGFALLFETQEDFGWKRAEEAEGDEVAGAFALEVRQGAAGVQPCNQVGG